jgi:hypothetical protein
MLIISCFYHWETRKVGSKLWVVQFFQLKEQDGNPSGLTPPAAGGAVWGDSQSNYGIYGSSGGSAGADLQTTGIGVFGQNNTSGNGVVGYSESGTGVAGHSTSGYGVSGEGGNIGVYAHNLTTPGNVVYLATKGLAGDFHGDVAISGSVTVAGDIILNGGADCAEVFDVAETVHIEPGTVMVLDQDGALHQCHQAYDKRVAGAISGAGEYKPALILDRRQTEDYRVPVALVGKVYCKVDAQYAAIEVGDLLTTSPTPGHAMKADDPLKAFGSVIGKALRPLETGQGLVPILIALQ